MRAIFEIFIRDLKKICTNWAAILVIITLCILPSMYAWFNIKACWDPYAPEATQNIKVGVVNEDNGTDINGQHVDLGNQIVDELKANKKLGWEFLNAQQAQAKLNNETIFAVVTIPNNFSQDIMSFTSNNIKQGTIKYEVNEKINAIAPKITGKGADSIQQNISSVIVQTVTEKVFDVAKQLGMDLEGSIPVLDQLFGKIVDLQSRFGRLNQLVNEGGVEVGEIKSLLISIKQDLPNIDALLGNASNFSQDIQTFLDETNHQLDNITPAISNDLTIISTLGTKVASDLNQVIDAINQANSQAPTMIGQTVDKLTNLSNLTQSLIKLLTTLNIVDPQHQLTPIINQLKIFKNDIDDLINKLNAIKAEIEAGKKPDTTVISNLRDLAMKISSSATNINNTFVNEIAPNFKEILSQGFKTASSALSVINGASAKLPNVSSILNRGIDIANGGGDVIGYLKQNLPGVEDFVNNLVSKVDETKNSVNIQELITLITNNVKERADFLAQPVVLDEQQLFPMGNYGSAMTPFYTVLCLWVGATLLVSMLKVDAHSKFKAYQNYFGKLLLFVTLGAIQGLIVGWGDLHILGIYCQNPGLFLALTIFIAIVFNIIVYSLVSVFGNIGKVIAIILLVLQVAAGGGTYPVQLMSSFFQHINPFLPFTYGIGMSREAIGGVVPELLSFDILIFICLAIGSIVIGVCLKPLTNKLMIPFNKKFAESEISAEA